MNPKVDFYFEKDQKWNKEVNLLRTIALDCQLTEELKWGTPCYTLSGKNIVLIHDFKDYCALLFFKGVLLSDSDNLLFQQTKNMQAQRQIRFSSLEQLFEKKEKIKAYIYEAIELEKAGLQVQFKKTEDFEIAEEFQRKLQELPALKEAFEALTPGRQKAYLLHFSTPKQAKTREGRVEKCLEDILQGKGLND